MAIKDIIYQDTILLEDGDFVVDLSEQQHIQDIVFSGRGDWRQFPLVGVGITSTLNSNLSFDIIRKRIVNQLEYDNFEVEKVEVLEDNTTIIVAKQRENES